MDKAKVICLREIINATLKANPEFKGLTVSLGNARFSSDSVTFNKLTITESVTDGKVQDKTVVDFKRYAYMYGLTLEEIGKIVTHNGIRYEIAGLKKYSYQKRSVRPACLRSQHDDPRALESRTADIPSRFSEAARTF